MKHAPAFVTTIVSGLLLGSTLSVAAQEPERAAPVEVTGTVTEEHCPGVQAQYVGLVEQNRGFLCRQTWLMSDPRLDGTFARAWNLDFYHDGTGLVMGYATGRLETADGSWQLRPGLRGTIEGEPDPQDVVELFVLDGEAEHQGLVAVVLQVNREDGVVLEPVRLHGYIVDAEYPPSDFLPEDPA